MTHMAKTAPLILVVEDEPALERAIVAKLEKSGFTTVAVRTAEEAWSAVLENAAIEAVWLDHYLLGKETGVDLVIKLKADARLKDLPVFVVSNTGGADKNQMYVQLGVAKYFLKATSRLDHIIKEIKAHLQATS